MKLIPVKKYVKLTHLKFDNSKEFLEKLDRSCKQKEKFDFIDGVIFNEREFYITFGQFADEVPFVSDYKYLNIYYKSIQEKGKDYLTTSDYIWRWDADWFWCSKHFGAQNIVLRFLLGKWFLKSTVYWKIRFLAAKYKVADRLRKVKRIEKVESVVQDVEIPIENSEKFISLFKFIIDI